MEVQDVYQDSEEKWHIDYGFSHLMGLAIRVYFGQLFISLILFIPLLILGVLIGIAVGKSLPTENKTSQSLDAQHQSICNEPSKQGEI